MTSGNHAPDSLKYQWRLLALVLRSEWATGLDKSIAFEIIDNYMKDRGNSRASLRYLQEATGAERPNVIASIRRLVDRGPFSVVRLGAGTRPTEYKLHFDSVAENASGIVGDTASHDLPSGIAGDTSCGIADDTSGVASGIVGDTESVLRTRLTAGVQEDGNTNTPDPLAAGLSAAAGPRDPESAFDRFWSAFPRKFQKPKARSAWDKLAPDDELAERIALAASEWASHYEANPVDKKWMPAPANWLSGERYDEDLPSVYVDAKEAAVAKKKDKPTKVEPVQQAQPAVAPQPFTEIREVFTIKSAELDEENVGSKWLGIDLVSDDGVETDMMFCLESSKNVALQEKDLLRLNKLIDAAGVELDGYDTRPLVNARFLRVLSSKFGEWEFYPAWLDPAPRESRPPTAPSRPLPRGTFLKLAAAKPMPGTRTWLADDSELDGIGDEDEDLEEAA